MISFPDTTDHDLISLPAPVFAISFPFARCIQDHNADITTLLQAPTLQKLLLLQVFPKGISLVRKMKETHHVRMFITNNSTAYGYFSEQSHSKRHSCVIVKTCNTDWMLASGLSCIVDFACPDN